ncbi:putative disease resistance protein RGA4 [Ziziphus jujuba]|uniref:Disease resistance protein RGA4 n=1 Tax=Ziziphus jujuba TaxID=326968 RepID=A0ABM4A080_ZIZJJ|nr:putative disease resistance protein RGA4 [Ziziphus jujuba]
MEESTVSVITDSILLKLWYAAVQIRKKDVEGLKAFISPIIEALTDDPAKKQVEDLLASDEDKLKELLQGTFSSRMKGIPVGAEKKKIKNHEVKSTLVTLEDALYKADDLMEEVYNEATKPVPNSKQLVSLGDKLGGQMKNIIKDVAARGKATATTEEPHKIITKEWDPLVDMLNLDSWLDEHKKVVKEKLVEDRSTNGDQEQHVAVVAIVGYGGLGKTTLALNLFQEQMTNFDLPIWVNVPYDFNMRMRSLVEGIIVSKAKNSLHERIRTDPENCKTTTHQKTIHSETSDEIISFIEKKKQHLHNLNEDELYYELRKAIDGKRLLLVLDGVWDMHSEMWLAFKNLLANVVGDGSRILITTRSRLVGKITASTEKDVHMLTHLDERNSCDLFQRFAFPPGKPVKSEIVEIAVGIVKRCGGNPFALETVGKRLNSINLETEDWSSFFNTEFQKVVNEKILPSLKLSYDVLPPHLKHCFAYCGVFPQQSEIDVKNLIHLWIAQGLIFPSRGQQMEDVGYDYVKDLCERYSLFEQVEVDHENGFVTKCKMPNLIHELAVLVGRSRLATLKEKDKRIIDERTQNVSFHFHFDRSWKIPSLIHQKRPRIRSIILASQLQVENKKERLRKSACEKIISKCKKLRTLDLHSTGIKTVPESIGKLKYLRYLDLSQNKAIKVLPESITTIPSLMTLKLSSCYGLKELPEDIGKLVQLKHLEIDWCYSLTHMPPGLGQLTQLETLSEFVLKRSTGDGKQTPTLPKCLYTKDVDLESLEELAELNNLRGELKIKHLRNVDAEYSKVANLERKEHLKSLILSWELDLDSDGIDKAANKSQDTLEGLKPNSKLKELALFGYRGDKLSDWLLSLTNLVKFSLQKCKCKNLQPLTQLTTLKVLILDNMPSLKYISNKSDYHNSEITPSASTEFIKKLEEVRLTELPDLEGWWEESDASLAFPRLSKLIIEDCPKLHSMPLYPNLKEWLVLKNTSLVTFINTMKDKSFVKQTMYDESSSKQTVNDKNYHPFPLSNLQSLCIIGNMDGRSKEEIRWGSLKSLRFLRLDNVHKLKALPEGLQHVTTLKELEIWHCTIMNLQRWIGKFKQLQRLGVFSCPKLKSLPAEIKDLPDLETLEIVDCPVLLQRCQKDIGADWKKIKRIENILLQQQSQDHIKKICEDDALKTRDLYEYYWDPKHGKKSNSIKRTVLI